MGTDIRANRISNNIVPAYTISPHLGANGESLANAHQPTHAHPFVHPHAGPDNVGSNICATHGRTHHGEAVANTYSQAHDASYTGPVVYTVIVRSNLDAAHARAKVS
jgi:hypothetical protein